MSDINNELPSMIDGFGDDKLFAECTKSDKNGHSLELGISEDDKIITIGGRQIAGVGGGNMVVLPGLTSTWWDIARSQAEGKTVYLKFGIPGYFSTLVGPLTHALGTVADGNKIQAIKRAWYAAQYFTELKKINLAYRAPAGEIVPEEEGVEPTYQEGFVPFTYDEALQLAYGKLPLERFDLYMYGRGCAIYPPQEDYEGGEPKYTYRGYDVPAVPSSFDPSVDSTLDFSDYDPNLIDPDSREKAQADYDKWITRATSKGVLNITDLTGSSRPHVIEDYKTTDEYIRHLVGYYFDEIPDVILKKYTDRFNQFNMAFRMPVGEVVPVTDTPVYQNGYTPFEEGDAIKLITGQIDLAKYAVFDYADQVVDEFYDPNFDITLDFSDYVAPDLDDPEVHNEVDADYDDWVAQNYQQMVQDIYGQILPTVLGVLYDTLLPYEVDLDITLGGVLRVGMGIAYKRSMPFITPRYLVIGLPNTYAVDLASFREAGVDLSSLEGILEALGQFTQGNLTETLAGIGNGESNGSLISGGESGGIGGIIGGLIGGNQKSSKSVSDGNLTKGGVTRLAVTRNGDELNENENEDNPSNESGDSEDDSNSIVDLLGIDPEQLTGVILGLTEATFGRNDDIFYLFAMGMDINRRMSTIPGLDDLLGPDTTLELDPHKGFIIDVNGWNIFAPLTGDANQGIMLDKLIDMLEEIEPYIEQISEQFPEIEYIQGLIDAVSNLLGIGISLDHALEILRTVNNMTLSFSTVLTQRAVYHLVERGWPVSLLRFDKDAKRLYSTQCLAKVAGATPSASVISLSNMGGMIGTAIAELLIRALGNYNVETIVDYVLNIASGSVPGAPGGMDEAIKDAFAKFVPLFGLEWHGLTEIPMGMGVIDGLPHDLANIHVRAGITFRTDEDEDGGTTGTGITGVFTRTKLSVESMETDFIRNYIKLHDETPFNDVYRAAVLGKGVIYENLPSTATDTSVNVENAELKAAVTEQDSSDTAMRSWELHGEIVPTVYNDKKAVQMRIGAGDGSTIDMVGVENTENVPEYVPIEGDTGPESETFDNRIFEYDGNNFSVAAQVYHSEDLTPGKITSLKFHCGPGTADDYVIQVVVKEISREFEEFPDEPISLSAFEDYFDWDIDDLIYRGVVRFLPYGTVKIPVTKINLLDDDTEPEQSAVEYSGNGNLLVVIISVKYDPTIVRGELPTFFYKTDGSYTNQRCSIIGGEQIQIQPDPEPNPTMTAQYGVANITFGYNEPYAVPKYELPITIGDKNSSRTDDRVFGIGAKKVSISYQLYRSTDIGMSGKVSSMKYYCGNDSETGYRNLDVYIALVDASVDSFDGIDSFDDLDDILTVTRDDIVFEGKLEFAPRKTIEIPFGETREEYDPETGTYVETYVPIEVTIPQDKNLIVITNTYYLEDESEVTDFKTPSFHYTVDEDNSYDACTFCISSDISDITPVKHDDKHYWGDTPPTDISWDSAIRDGIPSVSLIFTDGVRYNITASEVPDEGSGNTGHYGPLPVNSTDAVWNASPVSESHMIYPAEYIQRGGLITGIRFYYSPYWDTTAYGYRSMTRHLKAYIRYTHYTAFTSKTDSVEPPTTGNLVFDGDVLFEARFKNNDLGEKHWLTLEFDEGVTFAYDGFHSLLISVYDYGEAEEPPTEKPPYEIFSCSLMPDTKNIMSIGSKAKKDSDTNENVSVPFSYNCVPLCNFVFSEDESVDPEPEQITDSDPITPDWEANRVEGAEPVEWKIVATETRAVYVNTIEDAIKNYEWFSPQGIDVYLEYKVSEELKSASLNNDYITDLNDFMPPWYPYFGGKTIRFKVVDASVINKSIFAIAESEEIINSYSAPVNSTLQGRASTSKAQTSSGPNLTVTVKYYLVAELGLYASVLSYVPRLTMDSKNDEWDSDSSDYYRLLDPIYFYRNHFWAYTLEYTEDEFAGNYYETEDLSAYVFMALTQNMLTIDFKDDTTAYQLYENNADSSHEPAVTFTSFEIARHGIERCSMARIFLYDNNDNGEVEINNNTAALFETPYSIGLYTDEVEWAKSFAEPITETLVPTYETIPNPGEGDPTEREYYAIATEYDMGIDTNSVNVLNIENYTDSDPVTIEDGNVSATFVVGEAHVPPSGIPSNINELYVYVEGDGTMSRVLPESKLYISNNKVGRFVNDGSNITIDDSTNVPISIYLDEKPIGTISTGETYILELVGPTFELRKVANGGMFLEPPDLSESNSGDFQE